MTEPPGGTIDDLFAKASRWIGVGGAIFATISFFMWMGIIFGPLSKLPGQYDEIINKLTLMEKRMDQADWAVESMKSRMDAMSGQILISSEDRAKTWDRLRGMDADLSHLKATALTREDFVEWIAALGARNKGISVPPLTRSRDQ